eukprot:256207_1
MGCKSSVPKNIHNNHSEYIPCKFNSSLSNGFKFENHKNQEIATTQTSSLSQVFINTSTIYGKTNQWKIRFDNCEYIFIRINVLNSKNHTNNISKTLPNTLSSSFNIIITLDRTSANDTNSGWDQLKINIPSIKYEIFAQQKQLNTQIVILSVSIISSSETVIKAFKSIHNISTNPTNDMKHNKNKQIIAEQKYAWVYTASKSNYKTHLIYGFIREIENNLLELKHKNQTIPVPIKELVFMFTDLFLYCKFNIERSEGFRFETINNLYTAISTDKHFHLWIDGKTKFSEQHCWKIVFKNCEKNFLRIQFDNTNKMNSVHYDTIGKNIMSRIDKLVKLPNPFTVIVILDRRDVYKNQYFIDDKDEEEVKRRKTKFGGWDRLKIKFMDIDYEINAERPQLIDDLELNLQIWSSSSCSVQVWEGYIE